MAKEYYINDNTFASCTNGVIPGKIKMISVDRRVSNKVFKMANTDDRFTPFSCKYAILLTVLVAAAIPALGFLAAFLLGLLLGIGLCAIATYSQEWEKFHPRVFIHGKNALTNKSQLKCILGGLVTPTFSPLVAFSRAGVNLATTLLEAFLLYIGGKGFIQIVKGYGAKIAVSYTAANYLLNMGTDKMVTQPIAKGITGEPEPEPDPISDIKDQISYLGDGTPYPVKNSDGEYVSRNASDYDNARGLGTATDQQHTANANAAGETARNNTSGQTEGNRAYNQEIQRQGTQINADQKQARSDYRDLYKRMAQREGLTGKAADDYARSQANKSSKRDAALRRTQARQDASLKREQAIAQAKQNAANNARNNALNDKAQRNKVFRAKLGGVVGGFLKSWAVGVLIGITNSVGKTTANNAIDARAEGWENEVIKKLGLNAVAVLK